jgi:hydrogenase maturation protease
MAKYKKSTLVLGIGNILQKDDGIGVHIVNNMIDKGAKTPDVEYLDGGTAGYDLLDSMKGRKKIIIIDALKADDSPGSVYRFPAEKLTMSTTGFSLHDAGVPSMIKMLDIMGEKPEIEIIGIVPEDITSLDIGISKSLEASIPRVMEIVHEAVR